MNKEKKYFAVYECQNFRIATPPKICEIEASPKNIAAFIASADFQKNYALYDNEGVCQVYTLGKFADLIPDGNLRKEILNYLIPMQTFERDIPPVKYKAEQKRIRHGLER